MHSFAEWKRYKRLDLSVEEKEKVEDARRIHRNQLQSEWRLNKKRKSVPDLEARRGKMDAANMLAPSCWILPKDFNASMHSINEVMQAKVSTTKSYPPPPS